jgi:hypothetical protein
LPIVIFLLHFALNPKKFAGFADRPEKGERELV